MATASVRCPRDCGPLPAKRQCPQWVGRSHPTHLEAVSRTRRLARAPPGAQMVRFVMAPTLGLGRLRPYQGHEGCWHSQGLQASASATAVAESGRSGADYSGEAGGTTRATTPGPARAAPEGPGQPHLRAPPAHRGRHGPGPGDQEQPGRGGTACRPGGHAPGAEFPGPAPTGPGGRLTLAPLPGRRHPRGLLYSPGNQPRITPFFLSRRIARKPTASREPIAMTRAQPPWDIPPSRLRV